MKKTSIGTLYCLSMMSSIFILIVGIFGSIFIPISLTDSFDNLLVVIFVIGISFLFVLFSLLQLIDLIRDLPSLKKHEYISITGKVIAFKKNIEPESGVQINDKPVVQIIERGNEIVLQINDKLTIGKTYKFNYLKHSKIAEVVEEI